MSEHDSELNKLIEIMPYLRKLVGKGVNIGVTDTKKLLYYDQDARIKINIKPGDIIPEGCLPYMAIKYGRRVSRKIPAEIFGTPMAGVSVPVKVGGRVVGSYLISRPVDREGNDPDEADFFRYYWPNSNDTGNIGKIKEQPAAGGGIHYYTFNDLVFCSNRMEKLIAMAKKISLNDVTVLIQGESGTGKEIIAQAVHNYGSRRKGPFIAVNCAAMPRELVQSELFGYEEGAFTGAKKGGKEGIFELANGGTIFLDEIGDMPLMAQANLLRVLQEKKVTRIGGCRVIPLDIRVIAATNKNLQERIQRNLFRQDLFYRLSATVLSVPPLRERREDIGIIFRHFISKYRQLLGRAGEIRISPVAERILTDYHWPGNVRELENTVISILNVLEGDTINIRDLPSSLRAGLDTPGCLQTLDEAEKKVIYDTLALYSNNISRAAKALGISRPTLYRKMKKFKIV